MRAHVLVSFCLLRSTLWFSCVGESSCQVCFSMYACESRLSIIRCLLLSIVSYLLCVVISTFCFVKYMYVCTCVYFRVYYTT